MSGPRAGIHVCDCKPETLTGAVTCPRQCWARSQADCGLPAPHCLWLVTWPLSLTYTASRNKVPAASTRGYQSVFSMSACQRDSLGNVLEPLSDILAQLSWRH